MRATLLQITCMLTVLTATNFAVEAQQTVKKVPRIGFLAGTQGPMVNTFQRAIRDLGYIEGTNIAIEYRYYEGRDDLIPHLIAELIRLQIDALVVLTLPSIREAKRATKTIPIIMVAGVDPVATGLVNSLAEPGGNLTGVTRLFQELSGKRLELLKEIVPGVSRVGVLLMAGAQGASRAFKQYEAAGQALNVRIESLEVPTPRPDLDDTFREAEKRRLNGLITTRGNVLVRDGRKIASLAVKNRLPLMAEGTDFAEVGALASYAASDDENFKRAAVFVDKVLKGAKPAELPVEQPTKFELAINLKTAKQIGLTIPPNVLARADRVIK